MRKKGGSISMFSEADNNQNGQNSKENIEELARNVFSLQDENQKIGLQNDKLAARVKDVVEYNQLLGCLLYTSPSPRD